MRSPGGYVPAIDGLRALAVVAVLLFHAGVPGASGGYLGVSVFFTISGFVITRSLLERSAHRRSRSAPLALGQFYARRVKRLLPASLLTILACAMLGRFGWIGRVPADEIRWTVLNAANWYQWRTGADYAAVFAQHAGAADPLVHFWSLAIEEQFYVAWPLVMLVLLRLSRRAAAAVTAALAMGLGLLVVVIGSGAGPLTAYYHTLFRVPEVLVGCVLAYVTPALARSPRAARAAAAAGVAALIAVVAAVVFTDSNSTAWPYSGLLPLWAVAPGLLVVAAGVPGPVSTVFAIRPAVELGRISYGVYLYHWPLFLVLQGRGWPWLTVAVVGIPVTIGLAAASFHLAERRITAARLRVRPTLLASLVGMLAVLAAATVTGGRTPATFAMPELDPEVLDAVGFAPASSNSSPDSTSPTVPTVPATEAPSPTSAAPSSTSEAPAEPLRVLVVGDSTAESLSVGFTEWALANPGTQVSVAAFGACGLLQGGQYRMGMLDAALQVECSVRHSETIPEALPLADVVVVLVTLADVWERSWDGGTTWLGPDDAEFRDRLTADYAAFADRVVAAGVPTLLWLRPPVSSFAPDGGEPREEVTFTDGTQAWIESVVAGLVGSHPGRVVTGDLRSWFEATGLTGDPSARPDGTHFSAEVARQIAADWLAPRLATLPRRD